MRVLRSLVVAGAAAMAASVSATPIVTQWQYSIASAFTGATYSDGEHSRVRRSGILSQWQSDV